MPVCPEQAAWSWKRRLGRRSSISRSCGWLPLMGHSDSHSPRRSPTRAWQMAPTPITPRLLWTRKVAGPQGLRGIEPIDPIPAQPVGVLALVDHQSNPDIEGTDQRRQRLAAPDSGYPSAAGCDRTRDLPLEFPLQGSLLGRLWFLPFGINWHSPLSKVNRQIVVPLHVVEAVDPDEDRGASRDVGRHLLRRDAAIAA